MSFGLSAMGFAILTGGLIYGAHLAHADALDCRRRNRTRGHRYCLRGKGYAAERPCGIAALSESDSPLSNHRDRLSTQQTWLRPRQTSPVL